jgi:flagellar biosynthesis regulator FlbT
MDTNKLQQIVKAEEYLESLLASVKLGQVEIESLNIESHVKKVPSSGGIVESKPNGRRTFTIEVRETP